MARLVIALAGCLLAALSQPAPAAAGQDEQQRLRERGHLVCGVSDGLVGFSAGSKGRWRGLSADMCRAVAAAIFDDVTRVAFVSVNSSDEYAALESGSIDILASVSAHTLTKGVRHKATAVVDYFYDRIRLLVPRSADRKEARSLDGATICVMAGTPGRQTVADNFRAAGLAVNLKPFENLDDGRRAFFAGHCKGMAGGTAMLQVTRKAYAAEPADYMILPQALGNMQLTLVVRSGNSWLEEVVRAAFYTMVEAEDLQITAANVDGLMRNQDPSACRLLCPSELSRGLGLSDRWAYSIIKQLGAYAEVYDRNLGAASSLNIPRGLNYVVEGGGLLYAPPLR